MGFMIDDLQNPSIGWGWSRQLMIAPTVFDEWVKGHPSGSRSRKPEPPKAGSGPFTSSLAATNRQRSDRKPMCSGQAWRVEMTPAGLDRSFRPDFQLLDDRPPLLGTGPHKSTERVPCLSFAREDLEPKIVNP